MNDVVAALLERGFSLPANIVEIKNYDVSTPMHVKMIN
jgi:hypothetical protein